MTERAHIQDCREEANRYAGREDFHRIFSEDREELYQLSFLLTRDLERAERCLVGGLEDCVTGNPVFREWVHSWAKCTIIKNAIRELRPRPNPSNSSLSATTFPDIDRLSSGQGGYFEINAVLGLQDFERFVFVMSAMEHHSEHDCARLLECSVLEIREARSRALKELKKLSSHRSFQDQIFVQEKK
jgi:DNA-directed RNA polymerase specialized sigma24 family protein